MIAFLIRLDLADARPSIAIRLSRHVSTNELEKISMLQPTSLKVVWSMATLALTGYSTRTYITSEPTIAHMSFSTWLMEDDTDLETPEKNFAWTSLWEQMVGGSLSADSATSSSPPSSTANLNLTSWLDALAVIIFIAALTRLKRSRGFADINPAEQSKAPSMIVEDIDTAPSGTRSGKSSPTEVAMLPMEASAAAVAATALDIKERVASVQADREAALAALVARDAVLAATEAERVQLRDATAAALAERDRAIATRDEAIAKAEAAEREAALRSAAAERAAEEAAAENARLVSALREAQIAPQPDSVPPSLLRNMMREAKAAMARDFEASQEAADAAARRATEAESALAATIDREAELKNELALSAAAAAQTECDVAQLREILESVIVLSPIPARAPAPVDCDSPSQPHFCMRSSTSEDGYMKRELGAAARERAALAMAVRRAQRDGQPRTPHGMATTWAKRAEAHVQAAEAGVRAWEHQKPDSSPTRASSVGNLSSHAPPSGKLSRSVTFLRMLPSRSKDRLVRRKLFV